MHRFSRIAPDALADLERRARTACVCFPGAVLPPGTRPARARVGIETSPADGSAVLWVERGVAYAGGNPEVARWLTEGSKRFGSFAALCHWLRHDLAAEYRAAAAPTPAGELTDLDTVRRGLAGPERPVLVEPDALHEELARQVRGQDAALRVLARRAADHLAKRRPRRPLNLLAVGPTGVGKTRSAELLAEALGRLAPPGAGFGYLRLDMAEYQERHRASQLLGAPQGYVGYGDGAQLVDALAANPRTVVLFDEIEKAHPSIFLTLMNAMDAGRLSTPSHGATGRELDCRQAIFLFTSNLECDGILDELDEREAWDDAARVDEIGRRRLRAAGLAPELLGRVKSFLVYQPLSLDARAEIVALAAARLADEYGLTLAHVAPAVILTLLKRSHGAAFGARPDEYLVEDLLAPCLARAAEAGLSGVVCIIGKGPFECQRA